MPSLKRSPANVDLSHLARSGTLAGIALAVLLAGCSPPDPSGPFDAPV